MPDVMTPDSMVSKLDTFEGMAEDQVTQEDRDVSHEFCCFNYSRKCVLISVCVGFRRDNCSR